MSGARTGAGPAYDVVVPTSGRPSLSALLDALAAGPGPLPERVIVVDDRPPGAEPAALAFDAPQALADRLAVLRGPGRGPAAARNVGWRAALSPWIAFLDDDVVPDPGWKRDVAADLDAPAEVGASQGRIHVPLPAGRRPTDWEGNVAGLQTARWATADMAYRRPVLAAVGGFDERFPRAYREDADLGLRVTRAGWRIASGRRGVVHPVRPAPASVSLSKQAGNADDVLMGALHGPRWRAAAGAPPGRLRRHVAVAACGTAAVAAALGGRRGTAAACATAWAAGTAELAWKRIAPGPRDAREVAVMAATSLLLPFAATGWRVAGHATLRRRLGDAGRAPHGTLLRAERRHAPDAVLFDRDGTLVVDVPYNGDPDRVEPVAGARDALDRLRRAGVRTGVVSNQSGVARGLITDQQVREVNARIEALLGPLGAWTWCPHGPEDGCGCRKPRPGLILEASRRLGVDPRKVAVVGDIGADVEAARAAGARAVLVPTPVTRAEEVAAAPAVAADLGSAVDLLLEGRA